MSAAPSAQAPSATEGQPSNANSPDYKPELDRLADEARRPPRKESPLHPLVEKVVEYVPAAAKVLGVKEDEATQPAREAPGGPPVRPVHDGHIEEFVRDQHRSKKGDIAPE